MKKHWLYLKYVVRHKWFVFLACRQLKVSLWRSLIHDWTKFLPCEWSPYSEKLYGKKVDKNEPDDFRYWLASEPDDFRYWLASGPVEAAFDNAWNHHQKNNKHHWQYWVLINDNDKSKTKCLPMPEKYAREMVADWWGAGRAITGKWDAFNWYMKNKDEILLFYSTREFVERTLSDSAAYFVAVEQMLAKRKTILGY